MHWLIIGCGYVGSRVARDVIKDGGRVTAITRKVERAREFEVQGIEPIIADITRPETLRTLPSADVWLHAVAHDRASPLPRRSVIVDGLANVLAVAREKGGRFIHLSTASVYGISDGSWVNESTPCEPATEAGQFALEAEGLLASLPNAIILRLAGIYGPGRLIARIEQLREQSLLPGLGESWLNLVHVDDIVQVVQRAASAETPSPLYLVSDDQPITRREFYVEVARLVETPLPRFECDARDCSGLPVSIISSGRTQGLNKRCRNTKIKEELGIQLFHPTIHSGLPASLG